jgi:hypothetical protein
LGTWDAVTAVPSEPPVTFILTDSGCKAAAGGLAGVADDPDWSEAHPPMARAKNANNGAERDLKFMNWWEERIRIIETRQRE